MSKTLEETISEYLYTRDDVLDMDSVDELARELAKRLS